MGESDQLPSSLSVARLAVEACGITVLVAAVGVVVVTAGYYLFGTGWMAGCLATAVCSLSSGAAHIAGVFPRGDLYAMARLFCGLAVRTGPPLLLAVWGLEIAQPPLEKSLVLFIILLYSVGLLADVLLTVARLKRSGAGTT